MDDFEVFKADNIVTLNEAGDVQCTGGFGKAVGAGESKHLLLAKWEKFGGEPEIEPVYDPVELLKGPPPPGLDRWPLKL